MTLGTGRRGRPGRLAGATIEQLQAEIDRRRAAAPMLRSRRDDLMHMISRIEEELSALGSSSGAAAEGPARRRRGRPPGARRGPGRPPGPSRRGRGPRARNTMNLVDALHQVLQGQTMSVTDAAEAVQKAGYKTSSPNFRTIVNAALITNRGRFQKVARGQYTAK